MTPELLETICCQDGQLQRLNFHQNRVRSSAQQLGFSSYPDLSKLEVPDFAKKGKFKCRVTFTESITGIGFMRYHIRPVRRLKLINADHIQYAHKFSDRSLINTAFQMREEADDILMVIDGYLTDTSYANVALWDGQQWHTPANPLLKGTRRAQLISSGAVTPVLLKPADLPKFKTIALFNAMMGLEEGPQISINKYNISSAAFDRG